MSSKENEYLCEEYILDRFNRTGLNTEVNHYTQALHSITDNIRISHPGLALSMIHGLTDEDIPGELRGPLDVQCHHLYGLIHAHWIVTARGLTKMVRYR